MSEIKVGDIRKDLDNGDIYVVTAIYSLYIVDEENTYCDCIFQDGGVISEMLVEFIKDDLLLKHYDTFNEAIISKEFNNKEISYE